MSACNLPSADVEWSPPEYFEEYRLLSPLGRGGMGEVYLAHDLLLDRLVAIKFISAIHIDGGMREQFLIEARAAARLQHPNVVTVYRVGQIEQRPYIISEFIRGQGLDHIKLPLPWQRVLEVAIGMARGLAAAHRRGVLHRDIKRSNVILTDEGEVKLLDFGLAKLTGGGPAIESAPAKASISREDMFAPTLDKTPVPKPAKPAKPAQLLSAGWSSDPAPLPPIPRALGQSRRDAPLPLPAIDPQLLPEWPVRDSDNSGIKGTPLYMAPEVLIGQPASRRSDVYSLGAVLYELCVGTPLHYDPGGALEDLRRIASKPEDRPLDLLAPGIEPHLASVVERCVRRQPMERYASAEELRDALEQLADTIQKVSLPEGNPYRGLLRFEFEHRWLFFGRKSEIGTLVDRLRTESFILIAGDSGVGKSSLCRAGVLPLVADGALGDKRSWQHVTLVPGRHPLAALAAAVSMGLGCDEEQLITELRQAPASLARTVHRQLGEDRGLFIFMDQMEELVTIGDRAESALVGEALASLEGRVHSIRLLATVRSDFLPRLATLSGLGDEISRALYILRPLSPAKIREVIIGPSQAKGVSFESEALIHKLVESTDDMDGGLPLLQFALAELWEVKTGNIITSQALESIGGVNGALARHADHVMGRLGQEQRVIARRILMNLVTLEETRTRRSEAELVREGAGAADVLAALVRGRLLVALDTPEGAAYEVAHEALIKGWGALHHWLAEAAVARTVKHRLESATTEWLRHERSPDLLWTARQFAKTALLQPVDLGPREADFLAASRRQAKQRLRLRAGVLASVPVLLGVLYGTVQLLAERDLDRRITNQLREGETLLRRGRATRSLADKKRAAAFVLFDQMRRQEGEQVWAQAMADAKEMDHLYVDATIKLESALSLDINQIEVRARLIEVLYDRALDAELAHKDEALRELLQRLALYDLAGQWQRRWNEPAQLSLTTEPADAEVTIGKYVEDQTGQRIVQGTRKLAHSPVTEPALERGSYLLTVRCPGRVTVNYPFILGRGESLQLTIPLPESKHIPPGLVFIPPGRFLFGAAGDDELRQKFINTVPSHQVYTGGYLIATTETTYGEYLEFLDRLPAARRPDLLPRAGSGGLNGMVELKDTAAGWQLTLQPGTTAQTVGLTTPYVYAERKERAQNDWLRFPVGGLSRANAEAYANWLSESGRVPGARLCTELEWERAARGADDRVYPTGNVLLPSAANYDESYGKKPAAMGPDMVGSHPESRSPFGVYDMAGNVWEWVASSLGPDESVGRSGSYSFDGLTARSINRSSIDASFRQADLGIRVCASRPL